MDDATEFNRLLDQLRAGDPEAMAVLNVKFGPYIRAAVRRRLNPRLRSRFDSLDFVQETWMAFLTDPPERDAFTSPARFRAFLETVACHKVIEVFRQRFHLQKDDITREDADRDFAMVPAVDPTPSQFAMAGEEWERMLSRLPPGHRAIAHHLRDGYTNEDIARMTNVSLSTVNRVIRRLREVTER